MCPGTNNVQPRNQGFVPAQDFPPKFNCGTTDWFLRTTVSSPVPRRKKNFPARCTGVCAPSPFPQLNILTRGGTKANMTFQIPHTMQYT